MADFMTVKDVSDYLLEHMTPRSFAVCGQQYMEVGEYLDSARFVADTNMNLVEYGVLRWRCMKKFLPHLAALRPDFSVATDTNVLDQALMANYFFTKGGITKLSQLALVLGRCSDQKARSLVRVGVNIIFLTMDDINENLTPEEVIRLERLCHESFKTVALILMAEVSPIRMTVGGLGNWVLVVVDAQFIIRFAELQSCNEHSTDSEFVASSEFFKNKLCSPQIEDILFKCSGRPNCGCNGEGEGVGYLCYGDGKLDPKDELHAKNRHLWSKFGRLTRNGMSSVSPKQHAFNCAMEEFRRLMKLTACKDVSNHKLLNACLEEGQFGDAFLERAFFAIIKMINAHRNGFFTLTETVADDQTPSERMAIGMPTADQREDRFMCVVECDVRRMTGTKSQDPKLMEVGVPLPTSRPPVAEVLRAAPMELRPPSNLRGVQSVSEREALRRQL